MIVIRLLILILVTVCPVTVNAGQTVSESVAGRWLSGNQEGWIEISVDIAGQLTGSIAGSADDGESTLPRFDKNNPDSSLRSRPLIGLEIMQGFKYDEHGRWAGGTIYDPNSGRTYQATLTQLDQNTLKVRGYIGISLLGRSDVWTRDN